MQWYLLKQQMLFAPAELLHDACNARHVAIQSLGDYLQHAVAVATVFADAVITE